MSHKITHEKELVIQHMYEDFLVQFLGATYVAVRSKTVKGKSLKKHALVVGFEHKVPLAALQPNDKFMDMFKAWRSGAMRIATPTLMALPKVLANENGDSIETDVIEFHQIKIPLPDAKAMKEGVPHGPDASIMGTPEEHQKKYRPVPGGVSYIACGSSACTINAWYRGDPNHAFHKSCLGKPWYGTLAYNGKNYTGCWHAGTNYHCAMDFATGKAYPAGHGMVQPSPYDTGMCPSDNVAERDEFIISVEPIGKYNDFDYSSGRALDLSFISPVVKDIGEIRRTRWMPNPRDKAASSSRTMGTTFGEVIATEVTISVNYMFFIATIKHCIQHSAQIAGGSSGSPFMTKGAGEADWAYTGANFAGSDAPDQNFACAGSYISAAYGAEFDWVMRPDDGEPPVAKPTITMSDNLLKPGDVFTLSGTGFTPNGPVSIHGVLNEDIECQTGEATADGDGKFSLELVMSCESSGYFTSFDSSTDVESNHVSFTIGSEPPADCTMSFISCILSNSGDYLAMVFCVIDYIICLINQGLSLDEVLKVLEKVKDLLVAEKGKK